MSARMDEVRMSLLRSSDSPKGVVYTRPEVVTNCLDISGFTESENILDMRALDIGCGYGQFIGKLARIIALASFSSPVA